MDIYKCLNKGLQFIECVITPHEVNKEMKVQKKKGMKERRNGGTEINGDKRMERMMN